MFQNFVIKMGESSCQISAIVFTLANSYGSPSAVFSRILWMFFIFRSNTICLKKYWLMWICSFFLLYNTHLLNNLQNTRCKFYFIAKNFFSINFTFFSICFYYAVNILTTLYRIASWNAARTYPVQCWHDMKVSFLVRSENYTQVCDQDFYRAGKVS